ncbi:MAG: tripartite tricarboxylate transporter substrate binding protein [Betaproteobacteria bacterium]|nr:tripartite tricarboxylate transporter substrate binding protein [Betaproteobacteria bacterium]
MTRIAQKLFLLALLAAAAMAASAADFPSKPVRLIVPYPPGGALDIEARLIAAKLRDTWNQPIVVENRPGASGALGVDHVAKSAPDGHTLVLNALQMVMTPHLQKTPFDLARDLVGVIKFADVYYVLAVSPKTGVSSLRELVERAKKEPGRLNYGSGGNGGALHLYVELVKRAANINLTHIPYKGNAMAMQAMLAGEVDVIFDISSAIIPHAKSGKLRPLVVTGAKPLATLPNVPPLDSVYPGVSSDSWHGIFAPSATPKAIIDQIAADIRAAVLSPGVANRFRDAGLEPTGVGPEQFAAIVRRDYERWGQLIRENNIRSD